MWLRIAAAVGLTLLVMGGFEFLDLAGGRGDDAHDAAHRWRELFWMLIFVVVMATALLAAARRWTEQLQHAFATARRRSRR